MYKRQTVDGKKYYFQSNGKAAVGSVKVKKAYYVFNEAGILQTGKKRLVTVKNKQYYACLLYTSYFRIVSDKYSV